MATVRLIRDLPLARLHGAGLTRLGLLREHVIDCHERDYPYTAEWGQALHDGCGASIAGIAWTSRQNDSSKALMLWGNRVEPNEDLSLVDHPISIDEEPGLELVRLACARAGIDFAG